MDEAQLEDADELKLDTTELEEIEFKQEFIEHDSASPLHLIREKEMEIRGRVLAAKREAEEIVADARRKAEEIIARAQEEAAALAQERAREIHSEAVKDAERVKEESLKQLEEMKKSIATAKAEAVRVVVDMVTDI